MQRPCSLYPFHSECLHLFIALYIIGLPCVRYMSVLCTWIAVILFLIRRLRLADKRSRSSIERSGRLSILSVRFVRSFVILTFSNSCCVCCVPTIYRSALWKCRLSSCTKFLRAVCSHISSLCWLIIINNYCSASSVLRISLTWVYAFEFAIRKKNAYRLLTHQLPLDHRE